MQSTLKSYAPRPKIGRPPPRVSATILPMPIVVPAQGARRTNHRYSYAALTALAIACLMLGFYRFAHPKETIVPPVAIAAIPAPANTMLTIQSSEGSLVGGLARLNDPRQEPPRAVVDTRAMNNADRQRLLAILSKD